MNKEEGNARCRCYKNEVVQSSSSSPSRLVVCNRHIGIDTYKPSVSLLPRSSHVYRYLSIATYLHIHTFIYIPTYISIHPYIQTYP